MMNGQSTSELCFRNLRCSTKNKDKLILNDLSGKFPFGSLIALMGPSGAGKTMLLNILSAYAPQNTTCASLQLNGRETTFEYLKSISCYLTQEIHLNDLLTVDENMCYAADFKLGATHSQQEKSDIIYQLLDSFGLVEARPTRAGKLSGGERKRLALALEMINDPSIIFLDEPTTGLDISTTHQILAHLKKIAGMGTTVVCTIHQVCASHFELFDLAYVIANGQCAYQGRPQELVQFLDGNGLPCSIYHNPADYLIELCCGDFGKEKAQRLVKASQNGGSNLQHNPKQLLSSGVSTRQIWNSTWTYQFNTLLRREFVKLQRNLFLTYLRFLGSNFIGLVIGLLFYDVGSDATKVFFNYNLFVSMAGNLILGGLLCPILSFPLEMNVVKREIHNRYYSIIQYYLSVSILDLPILIITGASTNMVIYYLSGQPLEKDRIILFLIFTILLYTTVNAVGFFFGTLLNLNYAIFFGIYSQLPLLSLSGFALMPQDLPKVLSKVSSAIYARAGVDSFLITSFGLRSRRLNCPTDHCFYRETHRFLREIEVDPFDYAWALYALIGWYVAVRVVTFYSMRYRLSLLS